VVSPANLETRRAPEEWFTGAVWMNPSPAEPPEAGVFQVHFEPGARTHWHTHPEGQILYILAGRGRARTDGGPLIEFDPGDVVSFAPNEKHWHGAAPDSFMVHLAINPAASSDGGTEWLEPVSDEQYEGNARPASSRASRPTG
jgi:quercetin dioxygenase-like cupin family protein